MLNAATTAATTRGVPPRRSGRPLIELVFVIDYTCFNHHCHEIKRGWRGRFRFPRGQHCPASGTNFSIAHFLDEVVTRRPKRCVSRIAKVTAPSRVS
jgi:hypothetical protein